MCSNVESSHVTACMTYFYHPEGEREQGDEGVHQCFDRSVMCVYFVLLLPLSTSYHIMFDMNYPIKEKGHFFLHDVTEYHKMLLKFSASSTTS